MNEPVVSVIIASYNSAGTIQRTLDSLRKQQTGHLFEIIIVDSSTDTAPDLIRSRFPEFTLLHFPTRKYAGEARNIAIKEARGEIIAFIDADCVAAPDWIDAIVTAHREGRPAVGGGIGNANPESYIGWAAYLLEYVQWMPDMPAGDTDDVAGANMSYDRELFTRFGPFVEGCYGSDTDFHWRMASKGMTIRFDPRITIGHRNIDRIGKFLSHEFEHGYGFARIRTNFCTFSRTQRLAYIILMPLIVLKVFFKIGFLTILRKRYFIKYLSVSPVLLLGAVAWTLGEGKGYLMGNKSVSHDHKLHMHW